MEGPELPVLYDDSARVIVNKPPGLVVEPGGFGPSVVELLAARLPPFDVEGVAQPGIVHRLDRETSGCLVLARTDEAVAALGRAFQEKRVDKRYWTLVGGAAAGGLPASPGVAEDLTPRILRGEAQASPCGSFSSRWQRFTLLPSSQEGGHSCCGGYCGRPKRCSLSW